MREYGAEPEKGTCLWCGRKLNKTAAWDGQFDLRSCAEAFAVTVANQAYTLRGASRLVVRAAS